MDEDVGDPVRVAADEVGGIAHEDDEAAIRRNGKAFEKAGVALCAVRRHTHPLGHAGQAVVDEHVSKPVRVAADEVGGAADEGDEPAIRRNGRASGAGVALCAVRGDTHPLGDAGQEVVDKDFHPQRFAVAGDEVDIVAGEGDEAAICRDGRLEKAADVLWGGQGRVHADQYGRLAGDSGLQGPEEHAPVGDDDAAPIDDGHGIRRGRRAVAGQLAPAEPEDAQDRLEHRVVVVLVLIPLCRLGL